MINISILSKQESIEGFLFIRNSCLVNVIALFTPVSHEYLTVGMREVERTYFFFTPLPYFKQDNFSLISFEHEISEQDFIQ